MRHGDVTDRRATSVRLFVFFFLSFPRAGTCTSISMGKTTEIPIWCARKMYVKKRGGSSAAIPFGVNLLKQFEANIDKTFLPVIAVAILLINTTEQNIAFDAGEMLHRNQWQFSFHQIWCKFSLFF